MARLHKWSHRLLRLIILVTLIALTTPGIAYALRSFCAKNNELISEGSMVPATEYADLTISKTVTNANGSKLTANPKTKSSVFTVTFSDGGVYQVKIGQTEQTIKSGDTITLTNNQSALIQNLPVGIAYSVIANPSPGYVASSLNANGTIVRQGAKVAFNGAYRDEAAKPPSAEKLPPNASTGKADVTPNAPSGGKGSVSPSGPEASSGSMPASGTGIDLTGPDGTPSKDVSSAFGTGGELTHNDSGATSAGLKPGAGVDPSPWLITLAVSACLLRYVLFAGQKRIN